MVPLKNVNCAWSEISLDAIEHNLNCFKAIAGGSKIMAVVKSSAYGLGAVEIAKTVAGNGIWAFGVALAEEAVLLRENGIKNDILVMEYTPAYNIGRLIELGITLTVFDLSSAKAIAKTANRLGKTAKVHIKIDSGMNRLGFISQDSATIDGICNIAKLKGVFIEGIFTHFSCADMIDKAYTKMQFASFMQVCDKLRDSGVSIPIRHACNSAAAMRFPEMHLDAVRIGISLYGYYPSDIEYNLILRPAVHLKTRIAQIKEIKQGEKISYGGTYQTTKKSKIAILSIGYADGYPRLLSGRARVLINGQFAPVIGTICMNQCIIDVTCVNNINIDDEVTLFGSQNGLSVTAEEIAALAGTNSYEILCQTGKRVPRYYYRNEEVVKALNYCIR